MKVSASGNCWGESPGDTGQMLYLAGMVRRKSKIENVAPALIGNRIQISRCSNRSKANLNGR